MAAACEDHRYVLSTCTITDARSPVINIHMHDNRHARSPVINNHMHDNRHVLSPVIITIALNGTCMTHIFIRVCAYLQRHLTINLRSPPSGRKRHGPDRLGCMAYGLNKRIDQRQPQSDAGARTGMRGRHDSRPVAGTRPWSSVQGDSYRGVRSKTIPQLSHVSLDVRMRPLPAIGARQREPRVQ